LILTSLKGDISERKEDLLVLSLLEKAGGLGYTNEYLFFCFDLLTAESLPVLFELLLTESVLIFSISES